MPVAVNADSHVLGATNQTQPLHPSPAHCVECAKKSKDSAHLLFASLHNIICISRWIVESVRSDQLRCPSLSLWKLPKLLLPDHIHCQRLAPVSSGTMRILRLMLSKRTWPNFLAAELSPGSPGVRSHLSQVQFENVSTPSRGSSSKSTPELCGRKQKTFGTRSKCWDKHECGQ